MAPIGPDWTGTNAEKGSLLNSKKKQPRVVFGLPDADIAGVLREITALREAIAADAALPYHQLDAVHANYRESARNLLHYLALRRRDLRPLQLRLAALGLSSLGRAESHVLASVDAVLAVLHRLARSPQPPRLLQPLCALGPDVVDFPRGQQLLAEHTQALVGPPHPARNVRIMVTMPSQAADDYRLIHNLLAQGMDCLRINCAHDSPAQWLRMIKHLRRAERALGRTCRIVMDLAGPKLRTGVIEPGPAVVRIRPSRDVFGRVVAPARVWLTSATAPLLPPAPAAACLPVPPRWLSRLRVGDDVEFADARNAPRSFRVVEVAVGGCWVEAKKTAYVVPGSVLHHVRGSAPVGNLPTLPLSLRLRTGDTLILTRDRKPGRPALVDCQGKVLAPAQIGCTLPEVFADVRPGEPIWFDDGKMGGVIVKVEPRRVVVRIEQARAEGGKLRSDQGINLPASELRLAALTKKDVKDLAFVARHADVVELSFVNTARDVELLQEHLVKLGRGETAVVLKIETRRGFANLPAILLAAMRLPCCGVMIARGDLAVECGFERLAEVQEEILWICEAAHVPVIWATQVLETLAKTGMPSRAEITDAAMGHRAECVMLNKGPHMLSAVRALDDILRRMQDHQTKKSAMLRELHLAHALPDEAARTKNPEQVNRH
jgi:pyruvate kinase